MKNNGRATFLNDRFAAKLYYWTYRFNLIFFIQCNLFYLFNGIFFIDCKLFWVYLMQSFLWVQSNHFLSIHYDLFYSLNATFFINQINLLRQIPKSEGTISASKFDGKLPDILVPCLYPFNLEAVAVTSFQNVLGVLTV